MMEAKFQYQIDLDRYLEIVNRKMVLERQIKINAANPEAIAPLRSEYRQLVEEGDKIYSENYQYFNEPKPY